MSRCICISTLNVRVLNAIADGTRPGGDDRGVWRQTVSRRNGRMAGRGMKRSIKQSDK